MGKAAARARTTEITRDIRYPMADPSTPVDKFNKLLNKSGRTPPM